MPVFPGGWRDRKYRRAVEAQDGVQASRQDLLVSPGPPPGAESFPADLIPRQRAGRFVATIALAACVQNPLLTLMAGPPEVLPPGDQVYPARTANDTLQRRFEAVRAQSGGNVLLGPLSGQDSVYGAPGQVPDYEWIVPPGRPFPRELRTHIDGGLTDVLAGQDQVYGAPGEAPAYDWQLPPKGRPRSIELRTGLLNGTGYLGQDTVYSAPGQAPDYDWPNPSLGPKRGRQYEQFPNRLTSVEFTDIPLPDGHSTQPDRIPRIDRQPAINAQNGGNQLLNLLPGQDSIYAGPGQVPPYDWPNPTRPTRRLFQQFEQSLNPNLIGQDTFFGAPGQAPTFNQRIPVRPLTRQYDQPNNLLPGLLSGVVQNPLVGPDWPNPTRARQALNGRLDQSIPLNLVTYGEPPCGQILMPAPRIVRVGLRIHPVGENTLANILTTPVVLLPDGRSVQPDRVPGPRRANPSFVASSPIWLIGQDTVYGSFGQVPDYDWPNPRGYAYPITLRTIAANGTGYVPGPDPNIFGDPRLTALPPRGYPVGSRENRTWLQGNQIVSAQFDAPAGAGIFPQPRRDRLPLRDYPVGTNILAIVLTAPPPPLPDGHTYLPDQLLQVKRGRPDFVQSTPLNLIGKDTFYGTFGEVPAYDWQLPPKGRPFPVALRSELVNGTRFIVNTLYGDVGEVPPYDWPNPRGPIQPRRVYDPPNLLPGLLSFVAPPLPTGQAVMPHRVPGRLRANPHFIAATPIWLIGKDTVYGASGQVPTYDWQLPPKGRRFPVALRTALLNGTRFVGIDVIYGAAGQVPTYDLPNPPRGPARPINVQAPQNTIAVLTFVAPGDYTTALDSSTLTRFSATSDGGTVVTYVVFSDMTGNLYVARLE